MFGYALELDPILGIDTITGPLDADDYNGALALLTDQVNEQVTWVQDTSEVLSYTVNTDNADHPEVFYIVWKLASAPVDQVDIFTMMYPHDDHDFEDGDIRQCHVCGAANTLDWHNYCPSVMRPVRCQAGDGIHNACPEHAGQGGLGDD